MRLSVAFIALAFLAAAGFSAAQQRSTNQAATIGPAARVLPPTPNYHFPDGQTMVYAVEWHMLNAGIARVKIEAGPRDKITALADSLGVVNLLYTIHDRFEAYFDPRTNCSQRIVKHSEEGKRKHDTEVQFDYPRHKSVLTDKNLKAGETKRIESDVPNCVTDVVTGFYYLASQPLNLAGTYTFPISDGGKTTEVTAQVDGKEHLRVPAGSYQTIRVVAEPTSGPLKGKGKVWTWFSDDSSHIPVQIKAKLAWGTLLFRLQRLEK
jgi:hypothetical protein